MEINPNLAHFSAAQDSCVIHTKIQTYFPYIEYSIAAPMHSAPLGPSAVNLGLLLSAAQQCTQERNNSNSDTSFMEQKTV